MTGHEILNAMHSLLAAPAEGEEEFDNLQALADLLDAADNKLEAYRFVLLASKTRMAEAKEEAKRWTAAAKRNERVIDHVSAMALELMQAKRDIEGVTSCPVGPGKVMLTSSPRVDVLDEALIPEDFIRVKVEKSPDKAGILKALKDGASIPGVALATTESLRWS